MKTAVLFLALLLGFWPLEVLVPLAVFVWVYLELHKRLVKV